MKIINKYRQKVLGKVGLNLEIIKAKGSELIDIQGNHIVDMVAQFGAVPFGHNPDFIKNAIANYLESNNPIFIQPFKAKSTSLLAETLCRLAGKNYQYVVFANTGAETVEAAIKLVRLRTRRRKILSTFNSFHGKTYSALSATGSTKYSNELIVDDKNYDKIEFNNIPDLESYLSTQDYAAFMVEPIQGEGGMIPANSEYLKSAQALCEKYGTLFIADEIQTGIGRTGTMFASQGYEIEPDLILVSKALGGGMYPIGAVIAKKSAYAKKFDKMHSSTFANGGLAAHIANQTIHYLESETNILDEVKAKGEYLRNEFTKLQSEFGEYFSFTGTGLMYALRFRDEITKDNYIINYIQRQGAMSLMIAGYLLDQKKFFTMPFLGDGCGIRFEPSLTIELEQLELFVAAIRDVCKIIQRARYDLLFGYLVGYQQAEGDVERISYRKTNANSLIKLHTQTNQRKRFAFLMHSTNRPDLVRALPLAMAEEFNDEQKNCFADWMMEFGKIEFGPETVVNVEMTSQQGVTVDGILIYSPIRPEDMMKLSRSEIRELLDGYLKVAKRENIDVVGLGAFTSVISRAGSDIVNDEFKFTTGNSFTALSTAESIKDYFGDSIDQKAISVIGARGSVGRLAAMELALYFKNVYLVGNPRSGIKPLLENCASMIVELIESGARSLSGSAFNRIRKIIFQSGYTEHYIVKQLKESGAEQIKQLMEMAEKQNVPFPFEVSVEINDFVNRTDCVLSATSEGKPFIQADTFKAGTVIFDAARPFDFIPSEYNKTHVFEGGLVSQPEAILFGDCNMIGTPAGVNLACLSETIALSMEDVNRNYSIGKQISYQEAKTVFEIAIRHGFKPFKYESISRQKVS
ncbi:aminotransferase class III-fold pyridoxal phosphate-dependent enzyme [Moorena producens JHB]|uniref:Aminotransferase class III-fold pyridoxal phosphate-dependent enzyme n=1 Tax=Moorena producens (strain JHB) TaxID=1454205 RepID=A0A1D9G470_MOOP1|nr:aminotransferase class III-fold pyridoxal phosphate-dependent enzyme [Moorena producens]AOY82442.1 aminotransferase class III-fold pyridoxal phosphate-dependent enzyme [Moorena producens JHB]